MNFYELQKEKENLKKKDDDNFFDQIPLELAFVQMCVKISLKLKAAKLNKNLVYQQIN